jgi:hypothetical protein
MAKGGGHKGLMEGFCYVKAKGGGHSGLLMVKLDMVVQLEIEKIFPQNYLTIIYIYLHFYPI